MFTLDQLKEYGADTETAMERCMNMEAFYYKLIGMCLADGNFDALGGKLAENDLHGAFEAAHALKGVVGNLALTPLFDAVCAIVEPLRIEDTSCDYDTLYKEIMAQKAVLEEMSK